MRLHGLRQLDDWSVASCQQICCMLIFKTCYPQAFSDLVVQQHSQKRQLRVASGQFDRLVLLISTKIIEKSQQQNIVLTGIKVIVCVYSVEFVLLLHIILELTLGHCTRSVICPESLY